MTEMAAMPIKISYMPDPPVMEKSHGISTDLMVLWREVPISRILKKSIYFNFQTVRPKTSQCYERVRSE